MVPRFLSSLHVVASPKKSPLFPRCVGAAAFLA